MDELDEKIWSLVRRRLSLLRFGIRLIAVEMKRDDCWNEGKR